jgi:hypothetical protein
MRRRLRLRVWLRLRLLQLLRKVEDAHRPFEGERPAALQMDDERGIAS